MSYLMENEKEAIRLDIKTDPSKVVEQAAWAGLRQGMRVADVGCGSGKATSVLGGQVLPGGEIVGIDGSRERIEYASRHFGTKNCRFVCRDLQDPLDDLGPFDFVWVRFLLEYFRRDSFRIVQHLSSLVKPGGILCLIDLDYNCLSHFGISARLEKAVNDLIRFLQEEADFDPYVGRKLYSYLYDLGFEQIDVRMSAHHLIFGEAKERHIFNWMTKIKVAARHGAELLKDYEGGCDGFMREIEEYFLDRRRFIYTPLIAVRGVRRAE